jgi:hypothetical protein
MENLGEQGSRGFPSGNTAVLAAAGQMLYSQRRSTPWERTIAMSERNGTSRPVLTAEVVAPAEPRWLVLVMLFLLMGALAAPMLWRSPHFSRRAKAALTVPAVIQTAIALGVIAWVVVWFFERVSALYM